MLQRWLIVWLGLLSLLAYFWPTLIPSAFDPFTASRAYLQYLIALIMLTIGSLLPRDELVQVVRRWPTVLFGTAVQYTAMPLLALAVSTFLISDPNEQIGVILVGCVPGAMASNVLTLMARGNVSYSVSLTTAATILSPLVVPFVLWLMLRRTVELDPLHAFVTLVLTVVLPVLVGHLISRWWRRWADLSREMGPTIANLAILWVIAAVVGINRDRLNETGIVEVSALLGINVCGFVIGYFAGAAVRLPEGKRRALTLEIGMQNAGLGTFLAINELGNNSAAVLPAFYTFGCMLTGTMLARWWSRYPVTE